MSGVGFAWAAEGAFITYRAYSDKRTVVGLPVPGDYLATFLVFGGLAAISSAPRARTLATVVAFGIVAATALNVIDPTFVKKANAKLLGTGQKGSGSGQPGQLDSATNQAPGTTTAGGRG